MAHKAWRGKYGKFVIHGQEDIIEQALTYDFSSVIDVGAGNLSASLKFLSEGKKTTATVNNPSHYDVMDFDENLKFIEDINIETYSGKGMTYDAVWCAHVVEHTMNPGLAIKSLRNLLNDDGILFLSVPPFKHEVVGGHLSIGWNLGVLMYFLLMSGFDVRNGSFIWHGYNVTAFVRKSKRINFEGIVGDAGDLDHLKPYFPEELNIKQGFDGLLEKVNWEWAIDPRVKRHPRTFIPTKHKY